MDQDGRRLMIMPAESFAKFSAEDLGAVIAYLNTVPAAGNRQPEPAMGPLGRVLLGAGLMGNIFPNELVDHAQPFVEMPEIGATVAYGAYMTGFCSSCHGPDLTGAQPPDPQSPRTPDISGGGHLAGWSEADFVQTIRTGVTPYGRNLNATYMPWRSFAKLDDAELQALYLYIQSQAGK